MENDPFLWFVRLLLPVLVLILLVDLYFRLEERSFVYQEVPAKELVRTAGEVRDHLTAALDLLELCFGHPVDPRAVRSVPVTLTAYSSTVEQCDDTPYVTASMHGVRTGVIAVSDDLMSEMGLRFGQRVLIPGHGIFEVRDRMNRRWSRRVDIWHEDTQVARHFGVQSGVLLWLDPPELTAPRSAAVAAPQRKTF